MLTPEQLQVLKADILLDPVLSALPMSNASGSVIAAAYNANAVPDFYVWKTTTPAADIFQAIDWNKLTPAAAPDGTTTWTNKNLQCQSKQLNIQTLLTGRDVIASGRSNIRSGLNDALTALPSKNDGTNQAAGWVAVEAAMKRLGTRAEKLFATGGNGAQATPADLVFDGMITPDDAVTARELP